jgi:hypothetical protein
VRGMYWQFRWTIGGRRGDGKARTTSTETALSVEVKLQVAADYSRLSRLVRATADCFASARGWRWLASPSIRAMARILNPPAVGFAMARRPSGWSCRTKSCRASRHLIRDRVLHFFYEPSRFHYIYTKL